MLVRHKKDGKFFNLHKTKGNAWFSVNDPIQELQHPYLLKVHYTFKYKENSYAVTDCTHSELTYHLMRELKFTEQRTRYYAAELISVLEYLIDQKFNNLPTLIGM